jgi:hypothetical protein
MIRCERGDLAGILKNLSLPEDALVFVANPAVSNDWSAVIEELTEAFDLSQTAARNGGPVVYVVDGDDLLGRRGTGRAMVACGLLSAARTLALETAKSGVPVNVLAFGENASAESAGFWVETLCGSNGPNGELIRLGGDHLGKALP